MRDLVPTLICLLAAAGSARTASVRKTEDGNKQPSRSLVKEASVRISILGPKEEGGAPEETKFGSFKVFSSAASIKTEEKASNFEQNTLGKIEVSNKPQLNWGSSGENGTSQARGTSRQAVTEDWSLWPQDSDGVPTVKYSIGNTMVAESTIRSAIAHYQEHTCLRFQDVGSSLWQHKVNFVAGDGCSSKIGRDLLTFLFGQNIYLHKNCDRVNVVVHEIGHAIGLFHEQSRNDRDSHVRINYLNANIFTWNNFVRQWFTRNFNTEYDYYSVMHYGPLSFSWNGGTTVATTDPMLQGLLVYPREGLSFMDKLIVNKLYRCTDRWLSQCPLLVEDPCKNLGYIGPDCVCRCPAGTSGNFCQIKVMNYTDALVAQYLPLNGKITTPGTVSSPGYPVPLSTMAVFTKVITAPSCKRVVLTVVGFQLAYRDSTNHRCQDEGVEIRDSASVLSGLWYCGQDLVPGQTITSKDSVMTLFYVRSAMDSNNNKGFSFSLTFEAINGCTRR